MVAVFLGFCKVLQEWWSSFATFFFLLAAGQEFFFYFIGAACNFFVPPSACRKFFSKSPTTPPQDLNGRPLREFRKLRRQLQRKRNIKIELCVKLSLLRLFHVEYLAQNRRSVLWLAWYQWFSRKDKEWRLALSSEPQIWQFHVVVCQTASKHCTKRRAVRAALLIFLFNQSNHLFVALSWPLLRCQILYSLLYSSSNLALIITLLIPVLHVDSGCW